MQSRTFANWTIGTYKKTRIGISSLSILPLKYFTIFQLNFYHFYILLNWCTVHLYYFSLWSFCQRDQQQCVSRSVGFTKQWVLKRFKTFKTMSVKTLETLSFKAFVKHWKHWYLIRFNMFNTLETMRFKTFEQLSSPLYYSGH